MDALIPLAPVAIGLATARIVPAAGMRPAAGISIWLGVLFVRAVAAVSGALLVLAYVPGTAIFQAIKAWCLTAPVPVFQARFEIGTHSAIDLALLAPAVLLLVSLASISTAGVRAARGVAEWIRRDAVSSREDGSLVVRGPELVLASAGVRRPRILISAGALAALDDDELEAGLAHERAHLERRHGLISLLALCLYALARPLPGTARAHDELHFWLERDADEHAVRRTGDRLALASAICKVASGPVAGRVNPTLALAGHAGASARLAALLSPVVPPSRRQTWRSWGLTATMAMSSMAALALLLAAVSPVSAVAALVAHTPGLALCA